MDYTGFANSFTAGEIAPDAWDRVDIQQDQKGVAAAINATITVSGALAKRRGFWFVSSVLNPANAARLVPFRRSVNDALMLEFGDLEVRVWLSNGQPLLNGGVQVTFATTYAAAELANLRWLQVANVIYFRTADGRQPATLERLSDISWQWTTESFPNGPWLPENTDLSATITLTGTDENDANSTDNGGSILVGQVVSLAAAGCTPFDAAQIGACFRLRAANGNGSMHAWIPGTNFATGIYANSAGHCYRCSAGGANKTGSNPPVQLYGSPPQSDGDNVWDYRHDGAGVIRLTAVADSANATGTVLATVPLRSGVASSYWSEQAYSPYRGWPTAWPGLREERLAGGSTLNNLDILDLTESAGFYPDNENYHPGTGFDVTLAIDAIRVRCGDTNGQILWCATANYLIVGADDAEYLVAGSVLDEPLSPIGPPTVKKLSKFGSDPVQPVLPWNGLAFVQRGGKNLRYLSIDNQQGFTKDDFSVLAEHIGQRQFVQLAWLPAPDHILYARLADGGLAAMTYHQEQAVRGWTRQQLPGGVIGSLGPDAAPADFLPTAGGWICEDIATLPGPGRVETLWLIVSRTKAGVTQRAIWQQSQASDGLFLDGALFFSGAPTTAFAGLAALAGESVRALADGAEVDNLTVGGDGTVTLPKAASVVQIGQPYQVQIEGLKLSVGWSGGTLNTRQRMPAAIVSWKGVSAQFGLVGSAFLETELSRQLADIPAPIPRTARSEITTLGDGGEDGRDPRIRVFEDSAYDFRLYSFKPKAAAGG